jgi:threonine dehydrogenase-like Zn-dependent dehydrogenase
MKAVVWQAPGQIDLEEVPDARIEQSSDAVGRLTMSAICGTDLHMVRGMVPGTVLGHEGVGVVEAVGDNVRGFVPGDRVVIPSTICCGNCVYCRAGYTSQCDNANPNGPDEGTSFFGGPESTGPVNGLQASHARIPFAAANLIPLPDAVTDEQAIVLSDIHPTAWFGAKCAEVSGGDTVAVFGCGPVGQLAIASAWRMGAMTNARRRSAKPLAAVTPRGGTAPLPLRPRSGLSRRWPKPAASASSVSTRRPCGPGRSARR